MIETPVFYDSLTIPIIGAKQKLEYLVPENIKSGIYLMSTNIDDRIYTGSAKNLRKRFWYHSHLFEKNKHHSIYFQRFYNNHENLILYFDLLEECGVEDLLEREQFWMDEFQSYKKENGFNISPFANRPSGGNSLKAKQKRKETWAKNGHPCAGKPINKGIKKTEQTRKNMSSGQMGQKRKFSENIKREGSNHRAVIQIDEKGEEIAEFHSIAQAAKILNIPRDRITRICQGKYKHYKNFRFKYKFDGEFPEDTRDTRHAYLIVLKDNEIIFEGNCRQVGEFLQVNPTTITDSRKRGWCGEYEIREGQKPKKETPIREKKIMSEERKQKIRERMTGSGNHRFGKHIPNPKARKAVVQIDEENKDIKEFESASDAAKTLGIPPTQVSLICKSKAYSCRGFRFRYKDSAPPSMKKTFNKKIKIFVDKDMVFEGFQEEAAKFLGVCLCTFRKYKTLGKYLQYRIEEES